MLGEAFADLRVTARIMARLFRHTIDFKPSEGMLRGLWVRARAAFVDEKGPDAQHLTDYRLILNYELPLL